MVTTNKLISSCLPKYRTTKVYLQIVNAFIKEQKHHKSEHAYFLFIFKLPQTNDSFVKTCMIILFFKSKEKKQLSD